MEVKYFDEFLSLMQAYVKTQRLYYEHKGDYKRLNGMPHNFSELERIVSRKLHDEYTRLLDDQWQGSLITYNQAFVKFARQYNIEIIKYSEKATEQNKATKAYCQERLFQMVNESSVDPGKYRQYQTAYENSIDAMLYRQNQSFVNAYNKIEKELKRWTKDTFGIEDKILTEKPNSISFSPPTINFNHDAQLRLQQALKEFIAIEAQRLYLKELLAGKVASGTIVVNQQQNSLVYVFRQAKDAGHCNEDKTKIRDWLLHWFRVFDGKEVKALTPRTVYDALTKDTKPAKNKRIHYKP
ncbi:hypothetical protein [Spirosoma jeollabukense]